MRFKIAFFLVVLSTSGFSQSSSLGKFRKLSGAEKCWVLFHPFVAKKALKISEDTRRVTKEVMEEKLLKGKENGDQIDAFRHTYWMAYLTLEIGAKKARSLGKAHEKGNYRDYKKRKLEDGIMPDKIGSDMDFFNNEVGIDIAETTTEFDLQGTVISAIKNGKCKIVKTDGFGNFLDCAGSILHKDELKGRWKNDKCLVWSDESVDQ